jgi:acyl-CoA thioester hydrolase
MAADRPIDADYLHFTTITTRWSDNDIYGHVNNVIYYSYFDTAANLFLIDHAALDIHGGDVIALVVASRCAFHAAIAYPGHVRAGIRVDRLGQRAVTWAIGLFAAGDARAVAHGELAHVFVDRQTRRPVAIPGAARAALARIASPDVT